MTWEEILREGERRLSAAGIAEAGLDAWYLFERAFSTDRAHYYLRRGETAGEISGKTFDTSAAAFFEMIGRRAGRVPLQHILGVQEFMGMEFAVNGDVLIPRQDTETLVETVLAENRDENLSVLDMCAGSGCIAVSLAVMGKYGRIVAADISAAAVKMAGDNFERLAPELICAGRAEVRESDMFSAFSPGERFDVIVSNPPYIPTGDIGGLEPEVRDFEPKGALDGHEDGLCFYRRLTKESREFLKEEGKLYLEIGCDQAEAVSGLLAQNGFRNIRVIKDLAGKDRVVCAEAGTAAGIA